jgi:hypothetical protein
MILISFSLALIAIVYGAKLLAQSQKENLGGLYKYLAWFVITMGLLVLLCDGARGLMGMCHKGGGRMMNKECMMMDRGCDDGMMGGNCQMMMMHHHMNCGNNGCCEGMMNCGGNSNCSDGMMNCKDGGKGSSCNEGGMGSGSCPMMGNMKCKMDSGKAKK